MTSNASRTYFNVFIRENLESILIFLSKRVCLRNNIGKNQDLLLRCGEMWYKFIKLIWHIFNEIILILLNNYFFIALQCTQLLRYLDQNFFAFFYSFLFYLRKFWKIKSKFSQVFTKASRMEKMEFKLVLKVLNKKNLFNYKNKWICLRGIHFSFKLLCFHFIQL